METKKKSAPSRNQTPIPLSTSPSSGNTLQQPSYTQKLHHRHPTLMQSTSSKDSVKSWISQPINSRVTNQHSSAFLSTPTALFAHLILLDGDNNDDDDNNNNTLDLLSLYVFGTAVSMIHVIHTLASGVLFTHFKPNRKCGLGDLWGGESQGKGLRK